MVRFSTTEPLQFRMTLPGADLNMQAIRSSSRLRTSGVLLWTMLPCVALWVGLYVIKSALWTYGLYHVLCLLPAIIWGRSLWQSTLIAPSKRQSVLLII